MNLDEDKIKRIIEAAIFSAGRPLNLDKLAKLFEQQERPANTEIKKLLAQLMDDYKDRGISLVEVSNGWRFQSRDEFAPWLQRLWEERPTKYSRAALETLSLIAYRQPVTRGEIEKIRGVSVSSNIIKSFLEREWIRVIGHRDVPGRPALFATTKMFLDYFNLKNLDDLPTLSEIKDLEAFNPQLDLQEKNHQGQLAAMAEEQANNNQQTKANEDALEQLILEDETSQLEEHSSENSDAVADDNDVLIEDNSEQTISENDPSQDDSDQAQGIQVDASNIH